MKATQQQSKTTIGQQVDLGQAKRKSQDKGHKIKQIIYIYKTCTLSILLVDELDHRFLTFKQKEQRQICLVPDQ